MRKFYLALSAILGSLFLKAQTIDNVNFTFVPDPLTNNVTFTNTTVLQSDAPRKAFWNFGDGNIQATGTLAGTTHHYNAAGTYTVCLKIYKYFPNSNDSVLTGQECKQVVLQQMCTADFEWSNSITLNPLVHNVNFNINTNNSNRPIIQVCWNFGDGTDTCINATAATSASLSVHHKYLQSGTYNACIRIKYDGGCVAEKCHAVFLVAPTIADDCRANYEATAVSATSLGRKFIAQPWHSNSKKPVRICWTFGDGKDTCIEYSTTFTGQYYVEHTYKAAGDYPVCVKIKYDGGCEKQKCETIHIIAPPPPVAECTFTLNEAATNVSSLERKFYVGLMENRRAEKICWNFGDGTDTCVILTNLLNPQQLFITHHYPAPGAYTVCAKVYYVGCIVQRCRPVSITLPHSNMCGGYLIDSAISATTIHFKGVGIQAPPDNVVSYNWTFGDGTSGTGQQISHTYTSGGNYSVCLYLKTSTGCETRICKSLKVVSGTNVQQLVVSPNPVSNTLHALFHSQRTESVSVKIFNANGLLVRSYTKFAVTGPNNWDFDLATLPTGVYSVIVQSPYQFATAIVFKQ